MPSSSTPARHWRCTPPGPGALEGPPAAGGDRPCHGSRRLRRGTATLEFGPLFVVDSVQTFHEKRPTALDVIEAPAEIPGGFLATYRDAGGMTIYVMDQSTDAG